MAIPGGAGRLDQRVTLRKPTRLQGTAGEPITTHADDSSVWASVRPLRGREFIEARGFGAEVTHRVAIRYRSDVTSEWRIKLGTRTLRIVSVLNVNEGDEYQELMCVERAD